MVLMQHTQNPPKDSGYGYDDLRPFMSRMTGDEKHSEAATSTLDVVWTLYDRILNIDPADTSNPNRDRFLLSKGHGPMAFYSVLAAKGFIDVGTLSTFGSFDSPLGHHPDHKLINGVEISSGSLGQGLALAVGVALGMEIKGHNGRVFCLMGDGELDEGSVHEAIAAASRLRVSRLTAIVIDNNSAQHGWPGQIGDRFAVEGWRSVDVDGRSHDDIERAIATNHHDAPLVVVAKVGDRNA
ncbi:MAG: thiamine pyrophosphate-dependent enzyme [Acidimicrobiia bacterium]